MAKLLTVGQLAREFGLSRSTLLYYDRKKLLSPSSRSAANYRLYNNRDVERLELILTYRGVGLSLNEIASLLVSPKGRSASILASRLQGLNADIERLRQQQKVIIKIIGGSTHLKNARVMDKKQWVQLLEATGLDEQGMRKWHVEFEKAMPEMHQDFLESLGISKKEIRKIRESSKKGVK